MIPLQLLQTLTLDVPHTRTLCFGLWAAHFLSQGTQCFLVNCILTLFAFKLHHNFLLCANKWKDITGSLVGFFNLSRALGMICFNKNVYPVTQHPSLGSMTEGPIDTPEILMPIPKFRQELSIYVFLSPAKMVDFMHPKREGSIVINSLIFVLVRRNIFVLPKFEQGISMDKASIK